MGLSDNPDYVRYGGYGQAAVNYKSLDERVRLSLLVVKRGGWNLNANLRLEAFIGRVSQQSGIRNVFLRDARARSVSWIAVLRRSPGRLIRFWKGSIEERWHCAARRTCSICPFALG